MDTLWAVFPRANILGPICQIERFAALSLVPVKAPSTIPENFSKDLKRISRELPDDALAYDL